MLKQGIITVLVTMLFAVSPAMAGDKDKLSEDYKDNLEANRDSTNMPHPAHEMGEGDKSKSSDKSGKEMSQEYKDNVEKAKEGENMPHPAHEMGEGHTIEE